jgi:hypothetical protein
MRIGLGLLLLLAAAPVAGFDTALLGRLAGVAASPAPDGVLVFELLRRDLAVVAGGVRLTPEFGLTARAALQPVGAQALLLGELVVAEPQVNAVLDAALAGGLEVSALYDRFPAAQPALLSMHVTGFGDPETLALAIGKVFAALKASPGNKPSPSRAAINAADSRLDTAAIAAALGREGVQAGGVYTVSIERGTTLRGQQIGGVMGAGTRLRFAGRDPQTVLDGALAVRESELQQTLRALRGHGIAVTGIQSQFSGESPRLLFVRIWAVGSAGALARDLQAVLVAQDK